MAAQLSRTLVRGLEEAARRLPDGVLLYIVSGLRSQAHQAELRRRWDAGDRRGLIARPALHSKHTLGRAVDLVFGTDEGFYAVEDTELVWWVTLAGLAAPYGIKWGGQLDPNHFEV